MRPVMRNTKMMTRPCKVRSGHFGLTMMLLLAINIMLAAWELSPAAPDESLQAKLNVPVQTRKEKEWHNQMLSKWKDFLPSKPSEAAPPVAAAKQNTPADEQNNSLPSKPSGAAPPVAAAKQKSAADKQNNSLPGKPSGAAQPVAAAK
jgi:hypothetical protein